MSHYEPNDHTAAQNVRRALKRGSFSGRIKVRTERVEDGLLSCSVAQVSGDPKAVAQARRILSGTFEIGHDWGGAFRVFA